MNLNFNSSSFKKGMIPWNKGKGEMANPKICLFCKSEFYSRVKTRKFCSLKCSQLNPIDDSTRKKLSEYHKENPVKYWLGKSNPHVTGEKNNKWTGGKTSRDGYIYTLSKNHPHHNNENYVKDHRLVAEKILQRYLFPSEIIHHINGIKNDNRPENLYLFLNIKEHSRHHGYTIPPKLTSNLV